MTHARDRAEMSELSRMLSLLARLGDTGLVEAMIGKLVAQQGHDTADNVAILKAIGLFPLEQAAGLLQRIVAAGAVAALGACGALVADALKGAFAKKPARLIGAATVIIEALPGDPASAPKDQWGRPRVSRPDAAFVAAFASAVDRIDEALARRAAAHMLAWPQHFEIGRAHV